VKEYKYLGMWFDSHLRWKVHTETLKNKALSSVWGLKQFNSKYGVPSLQPVISPFNAMVRPQFQYGVEVLTFSGKLNWETEESICI
ncbi:hypothetical protein NDU88_005478, partial [Pleurodeles waltl]